MPKNEVYGLQGQIKRSSISIPSNITEGYGRFSTKSYIHFLKIARGSLLELETQIIITKELDFISTKSYDKSMDLIMQENKKINAFIKSIDK